MDHEEKQSVTDFFKKYRWAAAVLLAGLFLMTIPNGSTEKEEVPAVSIPAPTLQQQLEMLLSGLQGAGEVRVLLTAARGEQTHYQTDSDQHEQQLRQETVLINGTDRSEKGLISRTDPPVWLGAVVLCQGGDNPRVKLAVVEAVTTATGLTSDKISVLKMK